MLPDRVSNPGPLTYESGALPIALRGPACSDWSKFFLLRVYFILEVFRRSEKQTGSLKNCLPLKEWRNKDSCVPIHLLIIIS